MRSSSLRSWSMLLVWSIDLAFGYAGPVPCPKGPYERFLKLATRGPSLFSGRNGKIAPVGATVPRERWILVCGPNFLKYFGLCFKSFAIKPPGDWVHFLVKMGKLLLWALQCLNRAGLLFVSLIFKNIKGSASRALLQSHQGAEFILWWKWDHRSCGYYSASRQS